jgi:hypothetical protein
MSNTTNMFFPRTARAGDPTFVGAWLDQPTAFPIMRAPAAVAVARPDSPTT